MTPSIVDALKQVEEQRKAGDQRKIDEPSNDVSQNQSNDATASSPTEPAVGNPISHGDIISLYKKLNASETSEPKYSLERLLQGSQVYIPPPPPKQEPVSPPPYHYSPGPTTTDDCLSSPVRRIQSSHGPSSPRRRRPRLRTHGQPAASSKPSKADFQTPPMPLPRRTDLPKQKILATTKSRITRCNAK